MPGDKETYTIEYLQRVITEDIPKLDNKVKLIIQRKIEKLTNEPCLGYPLRGKLSGYYKLKISKYRVVYKIINERLIILIIAIGKRANSLIYKIAEKRIQIS